MATIKFTISAAPTTQTTEGITKFTYQADVTSGAPTANDGGRSISVTGSGVGAGTTVDITTIAASAGQTAKVKVTAAGDVLPRGEYSYETVNKKLEYTGMSDSQAVAETIRANLVKVVIGLTNSLAAAETNLKDDAGGPVSLGNFGTNQKYFRALENTATALYGATLTPDGIIAVNVPGLDGDDFNTLPSDDQVGVEVMQGRYAEASVSEAVMGIEGILRELSTDDKIFQDFLIYGKLNEDKEGFFGDDTVTRALYEFLQRLAIALFIDDDLDASINEIKNDPPDADIPQDGETWQKVIEDQIADVKKDAGAAVDSVKTTLGLGDADAAAEEAADSSPAVEIDNDAVKATVDGMLDEFTSTLDSGMKFAAPLSKFVNDKEYNTELKGYVSDIKANTSAVSYSSPLADRVRGSSPDVNALGEIQTRFPPKFKESYEDPSNGEFKKFLDEGKSGRLQDQDLQRLYANLLGFAKVLGLEQQVNSMVVGSGAAAAPPSAPVGSSAPTGTEAPEAAPGASSAAPAAPSELSAAPVDRGEVPTERQTSADTVLFRYTLFGVKPDTEPTMRIVFNDGNANDYTISKELVGSFQTFVVNGADRARFKQNVDTYALVKITAIPAGGGDPITQENQVFIPASLTDDMVFAFRFTASRGWIKNTGEAVGNRQAGRISNPQGEVYCVFWTVSGGVAEGTVDAQARVSGKTYTLTFAEGAPLLVPVVIPITRTQLKEGKYPHKTSKTLLKEAVPHWIFLSPGGDGAGGRGPGGRGGRGDGSGGRGGPGEGGAGADQKENMKVNIAISKLTFTTTGTWVTLPNTGNIVTENNFSFDVSSRKGDVPDSALSVTLDKAGLKSQGYDDGPYTNVNSVVGRAVFETLFLNSEAWRQVGGASLNCWIKDSTVVGTFDSITTREGYTRV